MTVWLLPPAATKPPGGLSLRVAEEGGVIVLHLALRHEAGCEEFLRDFRRAQQGAARSRAASCADRADIGEVAVALGVVDAIADHELVGDFEADPARLDVDLAA